MKNLTLISRVLGLGLGLGLEAQVLVNIIGFGTLHPPALGARTVTGPLCGDVTNGR